VSVTITGDRTKRRIPELSTIDLTSTSAVASYARAARAHCRDLAAEFDWAASEVQAALTHQAKHPLLASIPVRLRARRVARRLRRARDCAIGAGIEAVAFWHAYQREFAPVIEPPRARAPGGWDFRG
jgi:hypothetical protein